MLSLIISICTFIVGFGIGINIGYVKGAKDTGRGALEYFNKYLKKEK